VATGNRKQGKKKITLALQGGGSHTAYAWGVIDLLLQKDDLDIVAVSGTSGGAMIAAVMAYGLSIERDASGRLLDDASRRAQARELLAKFWQRVSTLGDLFWNPFRFVANPLHRSWNIDGMPIPLLLHAMSLIMSPYQSSLSPRQNPVALALTDCIDFDVLRSSKTGPALYVTATTVRTNQQKIFSKEEIHIPHLLASACLPVVDRAVQIGDEYYWDGGYVADPALMPLITHHRDVTNDMVIVGVNPIVVEPDMVPPNTSWEIIDRINEITFNASLIAEVKSIHEINELLDQVPPSAMAKQPGGKLHGKEKILIHYIPPHMEMAGLGVASKSNTAMPFLDHLYGLGQDVARAWYAGDLEGGGAPLIGKSSDTNLVRLFIDPHYADAPTIPRSLLGAHTTQGIALATTS